MSPQAKADAASIPRPSLSPGPYPKARLHGGDHVHRDQPLQLLGLFLQIQGPVHSEGTRNISTIFATAWEVPLWNLDKDWVQSICRSFAKNEMVALLKISGEDGGTLFELVTEQKPDLIQEKTDVYHESSHIGSIELGLTTRIYKKNNNEILLGSIVQMLLVVIGLIFSTRWIMNRILERPLGHLISRIDEISSGEYAKESKQFDHFEISVILDRFNHMASMVKSREDTLLETNKRLEMEISERKEAEIALGESENRYRQLVEDLPVGLFRASPEAEGPFLMGNPALAMMFGCSTVEEFSGTLVKDIYMDPGNAGAGSGYASGRRFHQGPGNRVQAKGRHTPGGTCHFSRGAGRRGEPPLRRRHHRRHHRAQEPGAAEAAGAEDGSHRDAGGRYRP